MNSRRRVNSTVMPLRVMMSLIADGANEMHEKSFTYFTFQLVGLLVGLLGYVSIALIPASLCGAFLIWLDVELESWVGLVVVTIGYFSILCFISLPIGKYIAALGVRLIDYSEKSWKDRIRHFGPDFKEPNFDDFNLTEADFNAYNRRFRLRDLSFIFFTALPVGSAYIFGYLFGNENMLKKFGMLAVVIIVAIITHFAMQFTDDFLDKRLPQHGAVEKYKEAMKLYEAVQTEIRNNESRASS